MRDVSCYKRFNFSEKPGIIIHEFFDDIVKFRVYHDSLGYGVELRNRINFFFQLFHSSL